MVAATKSKFHVNCACHRLSTSINTAWDSSCEESLELKELDVYANGLVKFVKKSGGIQYNLLATPKAGGKTRTLSASDSAAGRILKRNLVSGLDTKMWKDITALHVAASYI